MCVHYCFAFLMTGMCLSGENGTAFCSFFPNVCLMKSPLTALIVTGFLCLSSKMRLYKKHTDWKKTTKTPLCECSMDGCVPSLYSHCKIKTVCLV